MQATLLRAAATAELLPAGAYVATNPSEDRVPEGNTVGGTAIIYDRPALVSDDGRTHYFETFAPGCVDRSEARIRGRGEHSGLDLLHASATGVGGQIGKVDWVLRPDRLDFDATIDNADALAKVRSGAYRGVSIEFRPIRSTTSTHEGRKLIRRTEIALTGLALAPTGKGQLPGAGITRLRDIGSAQSDRYTRLVASVNLDAQLTETTGAAPGVFARSQSAQLDKLRRARKLYSDRNLLRIFAHSNDRPTAETARSQLRELESEETRTLLRTYGA
jgi:hypothetical protein